MERSLPYFQDFQKMQARFRAPFYYNSSVSKSQDFRKSFAVQKAVFSRELRYPLRNFPNSPRLFAIKFPTALDFSAVFVYTDGIDFKEAFYAFPCRKKVFHF